MKVNIIKKGLVTEKSSVINRGSTVISPNIKTERVFLDKDGNEIDPRTKQIIKRNNEQ